MGPVYAEVCVMYNYIVKTLILISSQEIQHSLQELALDTYGRKVLMYLLCPRSPAHFHPTIVKLLEKGDGNINRYDCSCNSDWSVRLGY